MKASQCNFCSPSQLPAKTLEHGVSTGKLTVDAWPGRHVLHIADTEITTRSWANPMKHGHVPLLLHGPRTESLFSADSRYRGRRLFRLLTEAYLGRLCILWLLVAMWQRQTDASEANDLLPLRNSRISVEESTIHRTTPDRRDAMQLLPWAKERNRRKTAGRFSPHNDIHVAVMADVLERRELLTIGPDGWTELVPSADSRVIYVSSSLGNDANSGLSEATPLQTISKALSLTRGGFPDWIRLRHGDQFTANLPLSRDGRSVNEPMVITGYGEGARPVINGKGFVYYRTNSVQLKYVAIVGLDFRGTGTDNGLHFGGGMNGILIEGNAFTNYNINVQIGAVDRSVVTAENISIRRNSLVEAESLGILAGQLDDVVFEENLLDANGYGEGYGNTPGQSGATVFKHNAYFTLTKNLTANGNIFARASNSGSKLKSDFVEGFTDFVVENNLYFNNMISMDSSSEPAPGITTYRHVRGLVKDNVFTELGREFANGDKQDMAAYVLNTAEVQWEGNHFVHKPAFAGNPLIMWASDERHRDITIRDSVVFDWHLRPTATPTDYFENNVHNPSPQAGITNLTLINNEIDLPAASYVDPERSVARYYASIGGTNDAAAFLMAARNMSKANWNPAFTADAVNDYIRAGFARVLATPVFSTPNNTTTSNPLQTVSWNTIDGADSYEVWYSSRTTDQDPLFKTSVSATSYTPVAGLPIGSYRIWVRAMQDGGPSSPWSVPLNLQINTAPVLSPLPTDGLNARPQLTWNPVPGALRYEVWGNNLTTGASGVVNSANITQTTYTPESDLGFGAYRFWVRGIDAKGVPSAWSGAQDYSRRNLAPTLQPVVFDGLNSLPTIAWNVIAGATRYELWASNLTIGTAGIIHERNILASTFVPAAPLPFGTNRFWVRAFDAASIASQWSPLLDASNLPALLNPVTSTFERRPTFTWQGLPGVAASELYLQVRGTVINPKGLTGPSWTPTVDLPVGDLRWWVRSSGSNGTMSAWSAEGRTFIGGRTTVLSAGVPAGDGNGQRVFSWQAVTGAGRYDLWVELVGTGVVIREMNLPGTSYTSSVPLAAGQYRVWVKAIDGADNVTGIWSNLFSFSVVETQRENQNTPTEPQLALRQLKSALSDEDLTTLGSDPSDMATAAQQETTASQDVTETVSSASGVPEPESIEDWTHPVMSGDALMSETYADLIDLVMSESHALAAAL